jgi:putative acyl-CoA dehydrogenase
LHARRIRGAQNDQVPTHEVFNQVPELVGHDVTASDPALRAGLDISGASLDAPLMHWGRLAGSADVLQTARLANTHPPLLRNYDRTGHRVDEVEYHAAWHQLMRDAVEAGIAGAAWVSGAAGGHLRRAAGFYIRTQAEAGHLCPISMSYAAVPVLRQQPELFQQYGSGLTARLYDPSLREPSAKTGILAGMSMTEKQGGSDVRAGTTTAVHDGGTYRLTGHKWFTSAPMSDLFLTLAKAPGGLTCFLLPRVLPDGARNAISLQRLKDKLGNRSNASAEIEYDGAVGWAVGEEGAGVRIILHMVTMTRLDCVLGSAGGLRAALSEAAHHAAHREAFGRRLVDQPVMAMVLADLAVESWASTMIGLRLAAAVDAGETDLLRLALPVSKFWVCKSTVAAIAEALECLGGNGYVEESVLPRLFRESPLNGIWEGSGNVTALDAVRARDRNGNAAPALIHELSKASGGNRIFDSTLPALKDLMNTADERSARALCSLAARMFGASLLIRGAPSDVADLYCATRLGATGSRTFGELPAGWDVSTIVAAVTPRIT